MPTVQSHRVPGRGGRTDLVDDRVEVLGVGVRAIRTPGPSLRIAEVEQACATKGSWSLVLTYAARSGAGRYPYQDISPGHTTAHSVQHGRGDAADTLGSDDCVDLNDSVAVDGETENGEWPPAENDDRSRCPVDHGRSDLRTWERP